MKTLSHEAQKGLMYTKAPSISSIHAWTICSGDH